MLKLRTALRTRARNDDRGATAVEYGLLVALIAAAVVAALVLLAPTIGKVFGAAGEDIDGSKTSIADAVAGGTGGGGGDGAGGGDGEGGGAADDYVSDGSVRVRTVDFACSEETLVTATATSTNGRPVVLWMEPVGGEDIFTYEESGTATDTWLVGAGETLYTYAIAEEIPELDHTYGSCVIDRDWTVQRWMKDEAFDWNTEFPAYAWTP